MYALVNLVPGPKTNLPFSTLSFYPRRTTVDKTHRGPSTKQKRRRKRRDPKGFSPHDKKVVLFLKGKVDKAEKNSGNLEVVMSTGCH